MRSLLRALPLAALCAAAVLAAPASAAQTDAGRDPLTGEPLVLGASAPPAAETAAAPSDARGGELVPVQHLAAGSTKLVRALGGDRIVYQDGSDLVVATAAGGGVTETGRYRIEAQPADAVVVGSRLYVALRKNLGVLILDVSGDAPAYVGQIAGPDALAVAVAGTTVYVGRGAAGVSAYDVSSVHTPVLLGTVDTPGSANGVAVSGALLAVADGNVNDGPDVRLYDVSVPGVFTPVGTAEAGGFATYVAFHAGRLYATGDAGLLAYDVSAPAAPVLLGTAAGAGTAYEVAFSGTRAFVAGLAGLREVDVSAPVPVETGAFDPGGQGLSVDVVNAGTVLFARRFEGLHVVSTGLPGQPQHLAFVQAGGFSFRGTFDTRGYLYVTDLAGGLRIFSPYLSSEQPAIEVARVPLPANTQEVLVVEQPAGVFRAYVTDADGAASGLSIVDVTHTGAPVVVGTYPVGPSYGMDTDEYGETLFVASGFAGLVAYDVRDETPVVLDDYPLGANTVDVAVDTDGGFGYVATFGGGLAVLYVANPSDISPLDAEPGWGFLNAVAIDEEPLNRNRLFVADGQHGLRLVDVTNAADILSVSTTPVASQARDVAVRAVAGFDPQFTNVFVAEDFTGMRRFRVSAYSSDQVEVTGTFVSGDRGIGVAVSPGETLPIAFRQVALMGGEAGVYVFLDSYPVSVEDAPVATRLAIEAVAPNPATSSASVRYRVDTPGAATVEVLDVLGRRVAVLAEGAHASGTHTASVDTRALAPGLYVVRLVQDGASATSRLAVTR